MSQELKEKREQKAEFLRETIDRCLKREPKLTIKELAGVIAMELGDDLMPFLKEYKKELII
jgi:hypothetical protein